MSPIQSNQTAETRWAQRRQTQQSLCVYRVSAFYSGSAYSVAAPLRWAICGLAVSLFASIQCQAQTNLPAHAIEVRQTASTGQAHGDETAQAVRAEELRAVCLEGRRCVCGRVLNVFPTGLLVESGYPSLLRDSLHGAWYLPGTVIASRPPNLVERKEPDSICVGTVFLTDLPKLRGAKIQPYDYVVLHSYPAGTYTYDSLGNTHTVRRFAGGLDTAVRLTLEAEQVAAASSAKQTR